MQGVARLSNTCFGAAAGLGMVLTISQLPRLTSPPALHHSNGRTSALRMLCYFVAVYLLSVLSLRAR
jgi:hypothetical protein